MTLVPSLARAKWTKLVFHFLPQWKLGAFFWGCFAPFRPWRWPRELRKVLVNAREDPMRINQHLCKRLGPFLGGNLGRVLFDKCYKFPLCSPRKITKDKSKPSFGTIVFTTTTTLFVCYISCHSRTLITSILYPPFWSGLVFFGRNHLCLWFTGHCHGYPSTGSGAYEEL